MDTSIHLFTPRKTYRKLDLLSEIIAQNIYVLSELSYKIPLYLTPIFLIWNEGPLNYKSCFQLLSLEFKNVGSFSQE
ncbi:MAG: hypothetical protein LHW47_01770 [Candidatus Cloacimonetes bacterium]|nr:hypothetical protein [Candidatus Cloacimonadota bacterium]